MKKIITLILAITMVFASAVSVFAVQDGFVESPSKDSVSLDSFDNESDGCNAVIIVTPYSDVDELEDTKEQENKDAYNEIVEKAEAFLKALKKLASLKNIDLSRLAVSEVFDVSYYEAAGHDGHGAFTITVSVKNLENFVGLLHRHNGEWQVVENASLNGDKITFTVDELSPFAIVVDTDAQNPEIPNTNTVADMTAQTLISAAAVALFSMLLVVVLRQKKIKE